ncbi:50S ribosomal protein L15 [Mycoplasma sp. E35C]|uniref:50S ribosomal protein L15 n=1 Tax=Mycoplasma sp. E35C TaxID=2801918 RepID=UPI001CA42A84|nr:50S ribosomal protein L15 [Mycoplasma sp. E35C]QZX49204.1 50S ribosomal protein L15 [Mycoplasma sp. E35C]
MKLHELKSTPKSRNHKAKVVGRGHGSGLGKTSGRGQKGQKARKSGHTRPGFEGGQTPLYRRLPKFGFKTVGFRKQTLSVSLDVLERLKETSINREVLVKYGIISSKTNEPVKIIGNKIDKKIDVKINKISEGAKKAIQAAGGSVELI